MSVKSAAFAIAVPHALQKGETVRAFRRVLGIDKHHFEEAVHRLAQGGQGGGAG